MRLGRRLRVSVDSVQVASWNASTDSAPWFRLAPVPGPAPSCSIRLRPRPPATRRRRCRRKYQSNARCASSFEQRGRRWRSRAAWQASMVAEASSGCWSNRPPSGPSRVRNRSVGTGRKQAGGRGSARRTASAGPGEARPRCQTQAGRAPGAGADQRLAQTGVIVGEVGFEPRARRPPRRALRSRSASELGLGHLVQQVAHERSWPTPASHSAGEAEDNERPRVRGEVSRSPNGGRRRGRSARAQRRWSACSPPLPR